MKKINNPSANCQNFNAEAQETRRREEKQENDHKTALNPPCLPSRLLVSCASALKFWQLAE